MSIMFPVEVVYGEPFELKDSIVEPTLKAILNALSKQCAQVQMLQQGKHKALVYPKARNVLF